MQAVRELRRVNSVTMAATATNLLADEQIDRVWLEATAAIGFRVERTTAAYAATDGRGTIFIGAPETLDDEDSLAQLVLHELCHALVQGEGHLHSRDWGLDNTDDRDVVHEHACLRLQAHLSDAHALRAALAPTTEWRSYYLGLPAAPLDGDDPACVLARAGVERAGTLKWRAALERALAETAALRDRKATAWPK